MKQLLGVFGALAVAACGGSDSDADGGAVVFDAPSGDYSITFPGEPSAVDLPVSLAGVSSAGDAYIFEDGSDVVEARSACIRFTDPSWPIRFAQLRSTLKQIHREPHSSGSIQPGVSQRATARLA